MVCHRCSASLQTIYLMYIVPQEREGAHKQHLAESHFLSQALKLGENLEKEGGISHGWATGCQSQRI